MNEEELNTLKRIANSLELISNSLNIITNTMNQPMTLKFENTITNSNNNQLNEKNLNKPNNPNNQLNENNVNTIQNNAPEICKPIENIPTNYLNNDLNNINSLLANPNDLHLPQFSHKRISNEVLIDKLKEKRINVKTFVDFKDEDRSLDNISIFMGERYKDIRRLYENIKTYLNRSSGFHLSMKNATQSEISSSCQLCTNLYDIAFLSEYKYEKSPKYFLHATPNKIPIAINFLTGHWLEIFIRKTVETCLNSMETDIEYTYLINPQITLPNGDDFELDVVFLINDEIFWIEGKTGNYQQYINKYSNVADIIGLDKDHSFMVLTDILNRTAAYILSKNFNMSVIPVGEFKTEIDNVIRKSLGIV